MITEATIREVRALSDSRAYLESVEKHIEGLKESVEKRITDYTKGLTDIEMDELLNIIKENK